MCVINVSNKRKTDKWRKICLFPAGFEPATLCVWGTRDNRYTKETSVLVNPKHGPWIVTIAPQIWHPAYFHCPWKAINIQVPRTFRRCQFLRSSFRWRPVCNRGLFPWCRLSPQRALLFHLLETILHNLFVQVLTTLSLKNWFWADFIETEISTGCQNCLKTHILYSKLSAVIILCSFESEPHWPFCSCSFFSVIYLNGHPRSTLEQ